MVHADHLASLRSRTGRLAASFAALVLVAVLAPATEAHKAITSPYTYNDHIFPIFRDRCGRCHFEGGPTPMSLLTYNEALPWAESMREQLMGERMPAWYADPLGPAVKGGHTVTPRELDMIITWATGGAPQGDLTKKPAAVPPPPSWSALGKPDLAVEMPAEHTLPPGTTEDTAEFTLSTDIAEPKWVGAVDVLPGTPSMVREVTVRLENGPVLVAWVPGFEPTPAPSGAAFKLPKGAKLQMLVRYKKHYLDEQNAVKDRTTVGLYFTDEPTTGKEIQAMAFDGKPSPEGSVDEQTFGASLKTGARVLAFRPLLDQTYANVDVHAVLPKGGRRVPLLLLRAARPEWPRRYWLTEPVELPPGTTIEATVKPEPPNPDDIPTPRRDKLQIGVDYVAQ
jgi:hypothetical protein